MDIELTINDALVKRLIATQFPQWKELPLWSVALSGWDNRTFHLGQKMSVRMPSREEYASQVEKEHRWLPILAPLLPLEIATPVVMGKPGEDYPWHWSVYRWIEGETAAQGKIADLCEFASSLAQFLLAFQRIDTSYGPAPGLHSFYRGGPLRHYDAETRGAIEKLKGKIDTKAALEVWENALTTDWRRPPVWVHGDISAGNLLVQEGKLKAVIDFGQLTVGDPACDLAVTWTFFSGESRRVFRSLLQLDTATWARARAWTLWKALIVASGVTNPNNFESLRSWRIIDEVLKEA